MFPRQFYFTQILSHSQILNGPRVLDYTRTRVKDKLLTIIAHESIEIVERESTGKPQDILYPGDLELTATLYVMTKRELKEFIHYIQTHPHHEVII